MQNKDPEKRKTRFWGKRIESLFDEILAAIVIGVIISFRDLILSNILYLILGAVLFFASFIIINRFKGKTWFKTISVFLITTFLVYFIFNIMIYYINLKIPKPILIVITIIPPLILTILYMIYVNLNKEIKEHLFENKFEWKYLLIGTIIVILAVIHVERLRELLEFRTIKEEIIENNMLVQYKNLNIQLVKIDDEISHYNNGLELETDFYISQFEITNRQYKIFVKENLDDPSILPRWMKNDWDGSYFDDCTEDDQPIVGISWEQAMKFCKWLSKSTGESYSLPTEKQWIYAARAGGRGMFGLGQNDEAINKTNLDKYAWYKDGNRDIKLHPIGQRLPNKFGLFDIWGNGEEWCLDADEDDFKLVKGGSWRDKFKYCLTDYRDSYPENYSRNTITFRMVKNSD